MYLRLLGYPGVLLSAFLFFSPVMNADAEGQQEKEIVDPIDEYIEDNAPWLVEIEYECHAYAEKWRSEWEREDWSREYSTHQLYNMVVKPWNQRLVSISGNSFLELADAIRELPNNSGKERVVDALEKEVSNKCQSVRIRKYNENKMKEREGEIQEMLE